MNRILGEGAHSRLVQPEYVAHLRHKILVVDVPGGGHNHAGRHVVVVKEINDVLADVLADFIHRSRDRPTECMIRPDGFI